MKTAQGCLQPSLPLPHLSRLPSSSESSLFLGELAGLIPVKVVVIGVLDSYSPGQSPAPALLFMFDLPFKFQKKLAELSIKDFSTCFFSPMTASVLAV